MIIRRVLPVCLLLAVVAGVVAASVSSPSLTPAPDCTVHLLLPTENRKLLAGDLDAFYQETSMHRSYGGHYGFVRSTESGEHPSLYDLFHEGVDIRPVKRDAKGEPLDVVSAALEGEVVYANDLPAKSNYGRYIMIRHDLPEGAVYSTYGHLARLYTEAGRRVKAGEKIGLMGWTGNVGCRERAHLHFEFGFRTLPDYGDWFSRLGKSLGEPGPNLHGEYNGLNFIGVDPAPILCAEAAGKAVTQRQIFQSLRPVMRVRVPAGPDFFYWQKCRPWMVEGGVQQSLPASWDIECDHVGIPLKFVPSKERVSNPVLLWFDNSLSAQDSVTRGLVEKRPTGRQLSRHGLKWFSQLTYLP